jgi:hypothetical protein
MEATADSVKLFLEAFNAQNENSGNLRSMPYGLGMAGRKKPFPGVIAERYTNQLHESTPSAWYLCTGSLNNMSRELLRWTGRTPCWSLNAVTTMSSAI